MLNKRFLVCGQLRINLDLVHWYEYIYRENRGSGIRFCFGKDDYLDFFPPLSSQMEEINAILNQLDIESKDNDDIVYV